MLRSARAYLPHTKLSLAITATAFIALAVLAVSARSWLAPAAASEPPAPAAAPVLQTNERLEAVTITIRPSGFEPSEITRSKGRFILVVNNRTWLEEIELRLEREDGGRVREVRRRRNKPDWREVVDLPPGQYVLKEANNPGWACRITIVSH